MDQDIQSYPAVYRATLISRLRPVLLCAFVYSLGMAGRFHLRATSPIWQWLTAILGFVFVMLLALSTSSCTVTLYADRIEKKTWFGKKIMKKSDVGEIRKRSFGLVMLAYKYNSGDGLVMPAGIGGDPIWKSWMASVRSDKLQ